MVSPGPGADASGRFRIEALPERCTGCLRCGLACSMLHDKTFNPSLARIHVVLKDAGCEITFDRSCTGCGACAGQCFYDALVRVSLEGKS